MGNIRSLGILLIFIQGFVSVGHAAGTDFYVGGTAGYVRNKGLGPDQVECLTPFALNSCSEDNRVIAGSVPTSVAANVHYNGFMWKIYGGYRINKYFNIEAGYSDLNHTKGTGIRTFYSPISPMNINTVFNTEFKYQVDGFLMEGVFRHKLSGKWEIRAKAGAYIWDADVEDVNQTAVTNPAFIGQGTASATGISFTGRLPPNFLSPSDVNELFKNFIEDRVKHNGISPVIGLGLHYRIMDDVSLHLDWDFYSDIGNGNVHAIGVGLQYH